MEDTKTKQLHIFVNNFENLKEQEKNIFSRIVNKLFQTNYITIQKNSDANDYRFIILYNELFSSFFKLSDFELEIKKHDEVIFIKNIHNFNKFRLKKEESLILLVISLLFYKKKDKISLNQKVEFFLNDIYKELNNIGFLEIKKLTKERMKNFLLLLRKYNIIDFQYNSNNLSDNLIITVFNSIIYLIDLEMIQQYKELLIKKENIN
ncbi:DUF4194 domain-containing protein [Texas Phoenix palm phytoplasma]|uniref:DUF4194 domain-containing protein n=1 Tax=Texas Phoenix palm phytoplasma TaxID=176709 RepID=A0ABS5BKK9_9MOLU|nr:DUF4194 domain-containing protein [Texas Phoenix palm phytoplasma]MBP3059307.1 DUF4194 domain-containing protein [Texas Phoenix palm phytoplasma]